jgi:adenylate kinase
MLNIILCGAPGCGKGTQSDLIVEKYGLTHLSTGDLMRKEIASGSELGKLIFSYISRGQLVPDSVTMEMLEKHIDSLPAETKGLVFDGFPRTENQAIELEKLMEKRGDKVARLLDIHVPEEEVISRLLERGKTSGRADDNLETIKERLVVYHNQTEPVAAHYKSLGKYEAVDGVGSIPEISARIQAVLNKIYC